MRAFHERQRPEDFRYSTYPGVEAERRFVPLDSVGVYVPGGLAPLPSSLVMGAVPAQAAGVRRIAVATPKPDPTILATARELGLDEIYCVGGAQAIAALAYGTETVQRVDKIVGPGPELDDRGQAARLERGRDRPARRPERGPDRRRRERRRRRFCAADLKAQAEHGPGSESLLVTTSAELAAAVRELVGDDEQIQIELVESLEQAIERSNDYAPEHLELMVADPEAALAGIRHAGAVFLGPYAPAVAGDYAVGTNHVLPTGGLAKSCGGLGLEAFLKPLEIVRIDRQGLERLAPIVSHAGPRGRPDRARRRRRGSPEGAETMSPAAPPSSGRLRRLQVDRRRRRTSRAGAASIRRA